MPVNRRSGEEGFTMIVTVIGLSLIAMLVLVAVTAVSGDSHLTGRDLNRKQAYEAAKAGIDEYAYHLHTNNGYWTECGNAEGPINQVGSTAETRPVPGNTGAKYAIEVIPATGHAACDPTSVSTATASMLQSLEPLKGTFRIRSTGFAGETKVGITATFKPASFLDYVYFTQLETSDPRTYGTESLIKAAEVQCAKTIREGRYSAEILSGKGYCDTISFVHEDNIKGPMHTNDAFVICKDPVLGRDANDPVEVSSPPTGWYSTKDPSLHNGSSCTGTPVFKGTFRTNSPVLIPPETNSQLASIAEPAFRFKGQVHICLSAKSMTVTSSGTTCAGNGPIVYSGPIPPNGVVYVENESCGGAYTPFLVTYEGGTSPCGNVYVQGHYTGQLTIAAANDIIVDGSLINESPEGILGLVANNFIRVYHPVNITENVNTKVKECTGNGAGVLSNLVIEAAVLAIQHSFIVDNYNCGASLGKLTVKGAIAQKYRGAVGTSGGTGYLKNYEYDERLHTIEPPSFIEPAHSDWVIGRETVG
jgi:type II secretory pathway pseudopilin PulG